MYFHEKIYSDRAEKKVPNFSHQADGVEIGGICLCNHIQVRRKCQIEKIFREVLPYKPGKAHNYSTADIKIFYPLSAVRHYTVH